MSPQPMPESLQASLVPDRSCDGCTVCCTSVAVRALDKPSYTKCKHECAAGCGIYDDKPGECAEYTCAWLDGFLPDDMKPNASGLLLERFYIQWPQRVEILCGFACSVLDGPTMEKIEASLPPGVIASIVFTADGDDDEAVSVTIGSEADVFAFETFIVAARKHGGTIEFTDGRVPFPTD